MHVCMAMVRNANSCSLQACNHLWPNNAFLFLSPHIRMYLIIGAQVDLDANGGFHPLHLAAATGNRSCLQALLEAGADPHTTDHERTTV